MRKIVTGVFLFAIGVDLLGVMYIPAPILGLLALVSGSLLLFGK